MTLKHKNKGTWAKNLLKKGNVNNPTNKLALQTQQQIHEQLKKKMSTMDSDDEDQQVEDSQDEVLPLNTEQNKKGLMGMKFMQRAMERQKVEYEKALAQTDDYDEIKEDSVEEKEEEEHSETPIEDGKSNPVKFIDSTYQIEQTRSGYHKTRLSGPLTIDTSSLNKPKEYLFEVEELSDEDIENKESNNQIQSNVKGLELSKKRKAVTELELNINEDNKDNQITIDLPKISAKKRVKENDDMDINTDNNISLVSGDDPKNNPWLKSGISKKTSSQKKQQKVKETSKELQLDVKNAIEKINTRAKNGKVKEKFNIMASANKDQQEMLKRAFGAPDLELEFENEKQEIINADIPKELPELPGWGLWGGEGTKPTVNKFIKKAKEKIEKIERKDDTLKNVIINEKRDKKAAKYLTKKLPFPYETQEQYERAMRNPLGKDWNASQVYNKMIQPRIIKKYGELIEPIKFSKKQYQQIQEKKKKRIPKNLIITKK